MPDPEPPATRPPCQHRGLPSSALYDLHGDPTHDHESTSTLFELKLNAYSDRDFLVWIDSQWRHWKFHRYRQHHQQKLHDLMVPILPVGSKGLPQCLRWTAGPKDDKFIRDMFRLFDICFFFGTLSIPYGGRKSPLVELIVDGTKGAGTKGYDDVRHGDTSRITHLHGDAHQRINIYPYPQVHYTDAMHLHIVIDTLIHEMIHAFLNIFLCRKGRCLSMKESIKGLTGHGAFFLLLQTRITTTVRSWGPSLQSFMRDTEYDGYFDACVDYTSLKLEMDAWRNKSERSSMVPPVPYTLPQWPTEVVGFRDEFAYLKDLIRRVAEHEEEEEHKNVSKKRKVEHVEEDSTEPSKDNAVAVAKPPRRSRRKTKSGGSRGT